MGAVIAFPVRENEYVKEYIRTMSKNRRSAPDFMDLLNAVGYLEGLLEQSGKQMAEMKSQLDELTEMRKHPLKTKLNSIYTAMKEGMESIKSRLAEIVKQIVDFCKKTLENFKAAGVSALDKTVSFLKLKEGLEAISSSAAKNNGLCGDAIGRIDAFSVEYHKGGAVLKNMGRLALGKEPVDTAKENGKLAAAVSAPYHAAKSIWAKIERTAFVMARDLGDFHTRAQTARDDRREAKENKREAKENERDAKETEKARKTDVFKSVEKHKEAVEAAAKDKPREAKKTKDGR
jgi:hypothetical protein